MGSQFRRARNEFVKDNGDSVVHDYADSVTFALFTKEEIRALSTCHVINPIAFNALGHPMPGQSVWMGRSVRVEMSLAVTIRL